jgi:hypothetical protein
VLALAALERAKVIARRAGRDARKAHASLAFRAAGPLNYPHRWPSVEGMRKIGHVKHTLDRDSKLHCAIALLAFERAHVETRLSRLNAGKLHRLATLSARKNADICDTK